MIIWTATRAALCILRRDDGIAYPPIYAKQFFYPDGLPELDKIAVERCAGRVLDIGAGAGSHSLAIQGRRLNVTSVDISAKAVRVMSERGCKDAKVGDVFDSYSEPFDTIFVILNIGIVQNLDGLARFLKRLETRMTGGGQLITDSIDSLNSEDESYRKYTQDKIAKGCYLGERCDLNIKTKPANGLNGCALTRKLSNNTLTKRAIR